MNIKPLAIAISVLFTGAAAAGEIYKSEENTVELSGWAKAVALYVDADAGDKEPHVFTDAHLKVKGTHELSEEAKLIGSFAINTGTSVSKDDKNAYFDDIKLEFDHVEYGNFSFGDTGNSFGAIEKAKQGEGSNLYIIGQGGVDGQGIRYKKTINDLEFSANYETDSDTNNDANYAASLNYKAEEFSAAVAYGSDGDDANSLGLAGDVTLGDFTFGAAFISFENAASLKASDSVELTLGKPNDGETYSVAAAYKFESFKVYGSLQYADGDLQGTAVEAQTAYLGLGYDVTDAFKTDLVLQTGSVEQDGDKEDGYGVKFVAKYSF
ncbi:porin [Vibrio hepatarius]|uniref:porin n=1 Tax=Vibrio hepatarius TaxID=171383 RepID=UPI00142D8556|nr:porin [Vibrio hepatarius]NIY83095.1 porin [Vibrio hepatarius]NVJ55824.1 porin [Vibrionaceae bacterium]